MYTFCSVSNDLFLSLYNTTYLVNNKYFNWFGTMFLLKIVKITECNAQQGLLALNGVNSKISLFEFS